MDGRRKEAREFIRYYVWSGHYDSDEVFDIIDDEVFGSDDSNETWLRGAIRSEFRKKRAAERKWPKVTSCDRLDRVFEALRDKGILTRHRCGYTQQDGLDVIDSLYEEEGGKKSGLVGYCFYHLQDMEATMGRSTRGLFLAFGSFSRSRKHGVEVGQLIRDEFERAGFEVVWDGTIKTRLMLEGFRWQRRSPR
jgi:hypothetical protein